MNRERRWTGQVAASAQNAPDARRGPALVGLRRLLEAIGHAIEDCVDRFNVDSQTTVKVATEELGEAAAPSAPPQDACFEIVGSLVKAVPAEAIGNDAVVHRPDRPVVV